MRSAPARLLVFLGDASYSIYLCTIPSRSVVEHFWRFFGKFGADTGVFLGARSALVGVMCYLFLERPLMRAFHNWYKPIPLHKNPRQRALERRVEFSRLMLGEKLEQHDSCAVEGIQSAKICPLNERSF